MAALETTMRIDVYHHVAFSDDIAQAVMTGLQPLLQTLQQQGQAAMAQLDDVKAALADLEAADQKAIMLIQQLAAKVEALKDDPVQLQALVDEMRLDAQSMSDAVTAASPPAPAPEPAPEPNQQPPQTQSV